MPLGFPNPVSDQYRRVAWEQLRTRLNGATSLIHGKIQGSLPVLTSEAIAGLDFLVRSMGNGHFPDYKNRESCLKNWESYCTKQGTLRGPRGGRAFPNRKSSPSNW